MRIKVFFPLFMLAAAAFPARAALGADYYVDQNHAAASDSNPGTEDQPWLTIQHGADTAVAGDNVYVKEGTYAERVHPGNSGSADAAITFEAVPRRSVDMHGFNTTGCDYLRIVGFRITSSDLFTGWDEVQGIFLNSNNVEVLDNYFYEMSSTAIAGYWHEPFPENAHIADNTIYWIQMGITISGRAWLVENNEVSRLYMYGSGDCDYSRFFGEDHVIRHNFFHGTSFDEIGEAHVDCFQTFTNNGEEVRNILFDGNVCYDFHQALMASNESGTDTHHFTFRNNIFAHGGAWGLCVHDISYITAENNTFAFIQYHGAGFRGSSTNNVMRNNIFYNVSSSYWGDEGGEVTGDYNLIYEAGDPSNPGEHDIFGMDPLFFDPEGDDYHLLEGSPAIDAGMELADVSADIEGISRPQGAGWDVGAHEFMADMPLSVSTSSLPDAAVGTPYSATLRAAGGSPPYTWDVTSGSLPDSLSLDGGAGEISGVPSAEGFFTFTAQVTDSAPDTASRELSITVHPAGSDAGVDAGQDAEGDPGDGDNGGGGCGCSVVR
jgi:hypothetical protein